MMKEERRRSVGGIVAGVVGATDLSGPGFAQDRGGFDLLQQFAQNVATPDHHRGGGGGGGDSGGGSGGKTLDPGPPGGQAGAGGPPPGPGPDELNFFTPPTARFTPIATVPD